MNDILIKIKANKYRNCVIIPIVFVLSRLILFHFLSDDYYFYGLISPQFAIAEAKNNGYIFAYDKELVSNYNRIAQIQNKHIPLEEWDPAYGSGIYSKFPITDLPGYGYLINFTSNIFKNHITSIYALLLQIAMELISLLLVSHILELVYSKRIALLFSFMYIIAYPFTWQMSIHPMRDIFIMPIYCISMYVSFVNSMYTTTQIKHIIFSILLIITACILIWIRPSGLYFFFILGFISLFSKRFTLTNKIIFIVIIICTPIITFSVPYEHFNIRHYGTKDTYIIGRGLYGVIGSDDNNPFGFVYHDEDLTTWLKSRGHDVAYGSIEMNKLLTNYATSAIKDKPIYFIKRILLSKIVILKAPLDSSIYKYTDDMKNHTIMQKFIKSPRRTVERIYGIAFFYVGLILTFLLLIKDIKNRALIMMLMSPLLYTLLIQVFNYEARYSAPAAWCLLIPYALLMDLAIKRSITRGYIPKEFILCESDRVHDKIPKSV